MSAKGRAGRIRRYLIGQLFHETHGFNPIVTEVETLTVRHGPAIIDHGRGTGMTLGGIISRLESLGHEIVPSVACFAKPSGPMEHGTYLALRDALLESARHERFDAVALDLHGAMGTTKIDDVEGDLLSHLRIAVGPDVPIGVGLDMHGHVTSAMLRNVDICIACKECPHTDFPATGERVIDLLEAVLDGSLSPVRVMAKAPMITLDSGLTASGPLAEVKAMAEMIAQEQPGILDISLLSVYRCADFKEAKGQTALVLANGAETEAPRIAEELAQWFWDNRERFREPVMPIAEALDRVATAKGQRPYVLGDLGDRTIAGGPGDSNAILAAALKRQDSLRGVIPVTDPLAVAVTRSFALGADVTVGIGGRMTPGFSPLTVTGQLLHVSDGEFVIEGPVFESEVESMGACAVLLVDGRLTVLLMSKPAMTHTPSAFTSQMIDLAVQDFIVSKSGQHFQANFKGVATPLTVESPGLTFPTKGFFPWTGPPFWPEHEIQSPRIVAQVFNNARAPKPRGALDVWA